MNEKNYDPTGAQEEQVVDEVKATKETAYPTHISELDRMRIENLNLKLHNNQMKHQQVLQQVQATKQEQEQLVVQMNELRVDLITRYNIDISTHMVMADGSFKPLQ